MNTLWPNHRSQPIYGTRFYRWTLWLEGSPDELDRVASVRYNLHPTFESGSAESSDRGLNFRIDAHGWGSFYIDVRIRYQAGIEERLSYFLDIGRFFSRTEPDRPRRYFESEILAAMLPIVYADGVRDFSGLRILPDDASALIGTALVGADFEGADFSDVSLSGANLARTNLTSARLVNVDLSGANLTMARVTEADMSGVVLHAVNRTDWIVSGVRASHVFLDVNRRRRVPATRDFGSREFEQWLLSLPDMEDVLPPESRTVFVSYNWNDDQPALAITQWLRDHGVRVLIDKQDFIPGSDLYDNMVGAIHTADKMLILYSHHSASRPYTTLERRIAQEVEARAMAEGQSRILSIYVCLDETPLPAESTHRLAIKTAGSGFLTVCERILAAIMEQPYESERYDWENHLERPPW